MFAGKKSAQIREILISESAWEEMTCLFAPSLNDPLENGGYVNKASGSKFMRIPVALMGDTVFCIAHKGTFPILDFEPTWTMDGRGVVVDGCRAACGCAIKTTLPTAGISK